VGDPVVENKLQTAHRHVVYFGTTQGAMCALMPLSEKVYRRLLMLQSVLCGALAHPAGLNPRAWRAPRPDGHAKLQNAQRGVLDGDLLRRFLLLSLVSRSETNLFSER